MKKSFWLVLVSILFAVVGCQYDDTDLQGKVKDMNDRLTTLEQKVADLNTQVNGIQGAIQALQANLYVTNVVVTRDASGAPTKYEITLSDGSTITLLPGIQGEKGDKGDKGAQGDKGEKGDTGDTGAQGDMPVVGVELVDGVYYWTVNGELLTDKDGNYVPVTGGLDGKDGVTPQFKIEDGSWWVSYDNGKTWDIIGLVSNSETSVVVTEYDEYVELDINGVKVSIPKEKAFTLVFEARNDLGVTEGVTVPFAYTIEGVAEGDETEVDVYGIIGSWKAEAVATDNTCGVINVTNIGGGTAKVFVYATNHKGKTDMVSLNFEAGVLDAAIEAENVPGEGGTITLKVEYNMDHEVSVPAEAQSWIHVAPATKATQTAEYVLMVDANTTAAPRSATIQIINKQTNESIKDIEIYQEAGASSVEPAYENWLGKWESVGSDGTKMEFTITKKVAGESYNISGFTDLIDPVEAGFDPATGDLLLKFYDSNKMLGSSYYLYIAGVGDNGYVAFGDEENEALGVVSLKTETTAVAKGNSYDYTFSDGETTHYNVLWMGVFGYGISGWTYFRDLDYIYFPANWTKTSGDTGNDDEMLKEYEKWLGDWTTIRQNRVWNATTETWDFDGEQLTDTWKIAEKEKGVSYFITGINGRTYPVVAEFDPATKGFSISSQQKIGTINFSGKDHPYDVHLYANILHTDGKNYYITPGSSPYVICTVEPTSSKEANIVPALSNTGLGSGIPFSGLRTTCEDPESPGSVTFIANNYWTNLPNKLVKVGGASNDAYSKWLGSWNTTLETRTFSGGTWGFAGDKSNDVWTFEQDVNNESYSITSMYDLNVKVKATFNSDGTFSLPNGQEGVGKVRFQGYDYDCDLCLYGTYFDASGIAYRISGNYDICYGELTSDKAANLLPVTIQVSGLGDGSVALSCPRLYALDPMDGKYYFFDGYEVVSLPNAMTKASASGAPKKTEGFSKKVEVSAIPANAVLGKIAVAKDIEQKEEITSVVLNSRVTPEKTASRVGTPIFAK